MAIKHLVTGGFGFADGTIYLPSLGFGFGSAVASYDSVVEAMVGLFDATPSLGDLLSDGSLWESYAPRGTALPFAVIFEVSDVPSRQYAGGHAETQIQVNIHAATYRQAKAIGRAFDAVFDGAAIVVDDVGARDCMRTGSLLERMESDRGPLNTDVHVQMLEYLVTTSGLRPA